MVLRAHAVTGGAMGRMLRVPAHGPEGPCCLGTLQQRCASVSSSSVFALFSIDQFGGDIRSALGRNDAQHVEMFLHIRFCQMLREYVSRIVFTIDFDKVNLACADLLWDPTILCV